MRCTHATWKLATLIAGLLLVDSAIGQTPTRIQPPPPPRTPRAASADDVMPPVWIGVRVTPVPDALASHIGRGGMMIANVAEDGPADLAGVERYDVLVSFAGREIDDMAGLQEAIADHGSAGPAEVIVIRGGREQVLSLTPRGDRAPVSLQFKYDEPGIPSASRSATNYFGGTLRMDPFGDWLVEPLGRLDSMPLDLLQELDELRSAMRFSPPAGFDLWMNDDPFAPAPPGLDLGGVFSITEVNDDQSISIRRDGDGRIHVERRAADGSETHAEYDDVDQVREDDPEAYRLIRKRAAVRVRPPGNYQDLLRSQADWQQHMREQLDALRSQIGNAPPAPPVSPSVRPGISSSLSVQAESLPDGRYRVRVNRDGQISEFEVDSLEEIPTRIEEALDVE